MSQELVVITGVSGHVGYRVLVEALSRNYQVRAIVRRSEQGEQIKTTRSVQPYLNSLEIVVVEDLLVPGAFDTVLMDATCVIHVASPLAIESDNYKRDVIDPAVQATVGILQSAAKTPSIRRVVITSSVATLLSWDYIISNDYTTVFTANDTYTPPDPNQAFQMPLQAYAVAKCHALAATNEFMKASTRHFDVVNILPTMIIGKNELNTRKEQLESGTNGTAIGPLIGRTLEMPSLGVSVHVNDVARAHVDVLNPAITGNKNLLVSSGGYNGTNWDDVKEIAKRVYGAHVASGLFNLAGSSPSRPLRLDVSETERVMGWKFASYEEQVRSVADHYIELASI